MSIDFVGKSARQKSTNFQYNQHLCTIHKTLAGFRPHSSEGKVLGRRSFYPSQFHGHFTFDLYDVFSVLCKHVCSDGLLCRILESSVYCVPLRYVYGVMVHVLHLSLDFRCCGTVRYHMNTIHSSRISSLRACEASWARKRCSARVVRAL